MPIARPKHWHAVALVCLALMVAPNLYAAQARKLVDIGPEANSPNAGLTLWQGKLYGTTFGGGAHNKGTVFQLTRSGSQWTKTIIHDFKGGSHDGALPTAEVAFDSAGNLYGGTQVGGPINCGTIYKLIPSNGTWTETIIYTFTCGPSDGGDVDAKLIFDAQGNLYGTTSTGGANGEGTVFQLAPSGSGWTLNTIYNFEASSQYSSPQGVVLNSDGSLLGFNTGAIYSLTNQNGTWVFNLLYTLCGSNDLCSPYSYPVLDGSGNVYGTASWGGAYNNGGLFQFNLITGVETILHSFQGGTQDGAVPEGSVLLDGTGHLWGTTFNGGASGDGTVYEFTPSTNAYQLVYSFVSSVGVAPIGALVRDNNGNLYGAAGGGGTQNKGTVFQVRP